MGTSARHNYLQGIPRRSRVALIAVTAIASIALVGCGDSGESSSPDTTNVAGSTANTTANTTATTNSTTADDEGLGGPEVRAVWPFDNSGDTYDDPVELVRSFASEYLGFTKLIVGEFEPGDDDDSGLVDIMSFEGGTLTRVSVARPDADGGWVVLGAENENLIVESPSLREKISSPLTVSGDSTAFEGTVDVLIREDGRMDPLGTGFATGGANGEMGPFSTTIDLAEGGSGHGAVIVRTQSMEDGGTAEATVVPIELG